LWYYWLDNYFYSTAGAIILRICYGYEVKDDNDPLVDIAERALDQVARYGITGDFMVDFLPSCKVITFQYFSQ
jgi:hypothetical protein